MKITDLFFLVAATEAFSNSRSRTFRPLINSLQSSYDADNQWFDTRHRTRTSQGGYGGTAPGSPEGWWGEPQTRSRAGSFVSMNEKKAEKDQTEQELWQEEMGNWFSEYLEENGYTHESDMETIKSIISKALTKGDEIDQTVSTQMSGDSSEAIVLKSADEEIIDGTISKEIEDNTSEAIVLKFTGKDENDELFTEENVAAMEEDSGNCPGSPQGWQEKSVVAFDKPSSPNFRSAATYEENCKSSIFY